MIVPFRPFYDAHARFVWRALLRLGVPERDAADAVQDVFVVVYRRLPEFEGRSKVTTWLFGICLRVASDRRKRAHVRLEVPTDHEAGALAEAGAGADALVERRRARALLDGVLERMPEEQRIVFVLFELEEITAVEIAELLDIPVGTVRSRLRLARESFRRSARQLEAAQAVSGAAFLRSVEARP